MLYVEDFIDDLHEYLKANLNDMIAIAGQWQNKRGNKIDDLKPVAPDSYVFGSLNSRIINNRDPLIIIAAERMELRESVQASAKSQDFTVTVGLLMKDSLVFTEGQEPHRKAWRYNSALEDCLASFDRNCAQEAHLEFQNISPYPADLMTSQNSWWATGFSIRVTIS